MSNIENLVNTTAPTPERGPRLNLAIGPNCPVRCEGCYNSFGNTASEGGIITASEVIDFATEIRDRVVLEHWF